MTVIVTLNGPIFQAISDVIERYRNDTYPRRPDNIRLIITDPVQLDLDLTQHITDLTLLKITLILLDIAQNYPNIAGYRPILAISSDIA